MVTRSKPSDHEIKKQHNNNNNNNNNNNTNKKNNNNNNNNYRPASYFCPHCSFPSNDL